MKTEEKENSKKDITIALVCAFLISFLLFFINPFNAPILAILALPVLASILITQLFKIVFSRIIESNSSRSAHKYSLSVLSFVLILFMLGSLKQLNLSDVVIVTVLMVGVSFYFSKNTLSLSKVSSDSFK